MRACQSDPLDSCLLTKLRRPAGQPSLSAAAWKTTASLFITALPFKLMNDASQFVGPVFLNLLLSSITRNDPPARSYLYAIGMFAGLILGCVCEGQYWQRSMRAGFRLRAAVVAAVYRRAPHHCEWSFRRCRACRGGRAGMRESALAHVHMAALAQNHGSARRERSPAKLEPALPGGRPSVLFDCTLGLTHCIRARSQSVRFVCKRRATGTRALRHETYSLYRCNPQAATLPHAVGAQHRAQSLSVLGYLSVHLVRFSDKGHTLVGIEDVASIVRREWGVRVLTQR